MANTGQQQTIYTIHESQLNNGSSAAGNMVMSGQSNSNSNNNNNGQQRNSQNDILIDTSSIPMTQQASMPPMQHHHQLQPQQQQQQQQYNNNNDTITSQPTLGPNPNAAGSARVAPEQQNVVYSVHPIFNMLDQHEALLIRQRADCTSTCCGFESVNTYTVRSKDGLPILKAIENSNCCERCCFEGNREYNLNLVHGDEIVARIRKPYRVSRFCCYSNSVRIESPEDNPIGQIKQLFTLFGHPRYAIYDCQLPPKRPSFLLESVSCRFCCTPFLCTCVCGNREFRIVDVESKEEVGTISRHWASSSSSSSAAAAARSAAHNQEQQADSDDQQQQQVILEQVSASGGDIEEPFGGGGGGGDSDDQLFGVQFSGNLEARHKVLLLSACFMMDFFYFENDRRRRKLASC